MLLRIISTSLKASQLVRRQLSRSFSTTVAMAHERSRHHVEVGRYGNLQYETAGSGDHVLLLIPGALGSTNTDFSPQLDNLDRDKFTVIALDLPGYGKSRPPEREWVDKFLHSDSDIARQFMKTLGHSKYSILGWSDGGNVGAIAAARAPESVRKLIVWGSNSFITKEELDMYDSIANIDNWSQRMKQGFIDEYGVEYFRKHWALWIEAVKVYYHKYDGNIYKDLLPSIQCPTLIVHGDKDAMVPKFHPEYLHKHIKNARAVYWPNGKHNIHLRYPDDFKAVVEKFLME